MHIMVPRFKKIITNLLFFLELQLLISAVITPILIAWGLPISTMSIVGNLLFTQFLTVFIFISALLFTSDIFGIPNYWLAQALELTTHTWHYFLSYGSAHWLIGFPLWMLPISTCCAIAACSLYYIHNISQNYRLILLTILCMITPITHIIFQKKSIHTIVMQGNQAMHLIKLHNIVYAFDCGALGARPSSQSWIEYTLAPTLINSMGATHIDTLIICKSNSRTQSAIDNLVQHIPTTRIVRLDKQIQNKLDHKSMIKYLIY